MLRRISAGKLRKNGGVGCASGAGVYRKACSIVSMTERCGSPTRSSIAPQ